MVNNETNSVSARGGLVPTRDQNIGRKPDELQILREAGAMLFALTSGRRSARETAHIVIAAWPRARRAAAAITRPAVFSITGSAP